MKIEQCTTSEQALEVQTEQVQFEPLRLSSETETKNAKGNCEREIVKQRIDTKRVKPFNIQLFKEFDPGSGRTLAARLTHASRTDEREACFSQVSGGRVSNT